MVVGRGEPGIGKSTLAAQVAAEVRARDGTRVVYGSADEHDRSAYGLWREPWALVAPAWALLDPALATEEQRWEVVTRLSEALVDGPPALLVLEDLHWADDLSLWVLARRPGLAGQRLAALATCRASGAAPVLEAAPPVGRRRPRREELRDEPIGGVTRPWPWPGDWAIPRCWPPRSSTATWPR